MNWALHTESVAFWYTKNVLSGKKKKIKKIILFTIVPKIMKYLLINLTKKMKDLYTKSTKLWSKNLNDKKECKDHKL